MQISTHKASLIQVVCGLVFSLLSPALPGQAAQGPKQPNQASLPDAPTPQTQAQASSYFSREPGEPDEVTIAGLPKRILFDEKQIVTSPSRFRMADVRWMAPLAATTGVLIDTDAHTMTLLHINASDQNRANNLSNGTLGILGALPAGMYLFGGPLARETSILTAESVADAMILTEGGKAIFLRDRPNVGNGQGDFFSSSFSDASFPSGHSTAAWAMASVIGDAYPGWFTRTLVYTLAATTSVSRVVAEKHFPSDVLVGSALGWAVGHYVYRAHHHYDLTPLQEPPEPRLSATASSARKQRVPTPTPTTPSAAAAVPAPAATVAPVPAPGVPAQTAPVTQQQASTAGLSKTLYDLQDVDTDKIGSPNMPMDSWVYPALERLGAMGFIPSQSLAIRPWTRLECARQVAEAADHLAGADQDGADFTKSEAREAERLLDGLEQEFDGRVLAHESLSLDSVYARYGTIAGPALADSYHFGQTWWNDFGRPLGRGGSALVGFSARATTGPIFAYVREEMQLGPGSPAYSASVEQLIAQLDSNPVQNTIATSSYTRYRPIEMYAGLAFGGNALSFGKQEIFWGPTTMGPLAFSSNAEPTYNLRFVSTRPHALPFFPNLGTYRFDLVMGKLSGHSFPTRPWYNGQKADFNLGKNLELSFTRWSILWGVGHPMTLGSLWRNLISFSSSVAGPNDRNDPGDRKSNFDFRYKLPWLRNEVTLYADAYSDDDPSPIAAPRRAVWNPGIYIARLPWLPHMDLRVEAVSSEGLATDFGGQHFFYNNQYHDANTNKSFMLGNAIGRDSRAEEGRVGWWVSAQTRVEAGYRQNKGGTAFLPGGSTISDGFVNARVQLSRHWSAQMFGQYERFLIPSYMTGAQSNGSGWLELTWTPEAEVVRPE
jgi:membrane-associated phospholipid phosphatase